MSNPASRAIDRGAYAPGMDLFGMSTFARAYKTHRIMAIEPNRSPRWGVPPQNLYWTKCGLAFFEDDFNDRPDFKDPCRPCRVPEF